MSLVDQSEKKQAFDKNVQTMAAASGQSSVFSKAQNNISSYELDHELAQTPLHVNEQPAVVYNDEAYHFEPFPIDDQGGHGIGIFGSSGSKNNKRLIVTSCVAGVTCSLIVGAVLFGALNGNWNSTDGSQKFWQQTESGGKGDLVTVSSTRAISPQNGTQVMASAYPGDASANLRQNASYNAGDLGPDYPDLNGQPLPYDHGDEQSDACHRIIMPHVAQNAQTSPDEIAISSLERLALPGARRV